MAWCNCDCRNLLQNNSHPKKLFLSPCDIFTAERYKELVASPTSDETLDSAQINRNATKKTQAMPNDRYIANASIPASNSIHSAERQIDKIFPPVEVKPICRDKLTIKLNVSRANADAKNRF